MLRGENIFRTWSGKSAEEDSLGKIASKIWYQEIKLHRYPGDAKGYAECKSVDPFEVGYFTQVRKPSVPNKQHRCVTIVTIPHSYHHNTDIMITTF